MVDSTGRATGQMVLLFVVAVGMICPLFSGFFLTWNVFLKKNQNAPRPSEHPPVMGEKCQNV